MSSRHPQRVGIDWGTSNRRAYVLNERGELLRQHDDEAGILHVNGDFRSSLQALLRTLKIEEADIVMSGMVGSRNGWQEAPYLDVSHPLSDLPAAMVEIDSGLPGVRCRIVPGYRYTDPQGMPDVMRGEETQVFGALQMSAANGWIVHPGTHSKWVRVEAGRVCELITFMTGELYALLSEHGTLSKVMSGKDAVPEAFASGVKAAAHDSFTHLAFAGRALVVTDRMPPEHTASWLSGLLIGTELHDILRRAGGRSDTSIQVIGSPALMTRYLNAFELLGLRARSWQPDEVYVAALRSLFNLSK
jgi:2-dehydro-3-deoxygalactonokinase